MTRPPRRPRKLLELWEDADGNYQIRIIVGAFQRRELGIADPIAAEFAASYEAIEALRKIVAASDAGTMRQARDDRLPPGAPDL